MVWLRKNPDTLYWSIQEIGLVAEIEWGKNWEISEDYQKLHVAGAAEVPIRLFVCDNRPPDLLADLQRQRQALGRTGCYIFAVYDQNQHQFQVEIEPCA